MDSRPLFPRFTLPALNRAQLDPNSSWLTWASQALAQADQGGELDGFGTPSTGLIATGDRFIGDADVLDALREALPGLKAVEMEGAAVAEDLALYILCQLLLVKFLKKEAFQKKNY